MRVLFRPSLSDLDLVAPDSRRLFPGRVMAALILVAMIIPTLGLVRGLAWGAVVVVGETLNWFATAPYGRGGPVTRFQRLRYLSAALGGNIAWLSLSLFFWFDNASGMAFLALMVWCAILFNALGYAFRSATALLVFGLPTLCVMAVLPLVHPRWGGPQQIFSVIGLLLCIVLVVSAALRNVRAAQELDQSRAEVEAERHRAEQANSAKSAFLAFMSHEIRTPLNGVLGMVQAMERDELTAVQRDRLAVVSSSGETLLFLLNDLLDLSRIEAGRLDLEDGVVDIAVLAEAACRAFTPLASEKDIALRLVIDPEAQGFWAGDPTRIRQILVNLVANAVKFTDRGEVAVTVAVVPDGLVLTVSDTGPGIAPDRLLALFDRFVQADSTTSRQHGGSGLGLAICRQLAELMGGSISAESRLGEGSSFIVRLPLGPAEAPPEVVAAPRLLEASDGPPLRLLVAEDNAVNRLVLDTLLGQVGLAPHFVENGLQAVEACAAARWDLVLMDIQMPVMDGPTAVRRIRAEELRDGRPRTPIIALTANAMAHHSAEYLEAGMDATVAKPIELGLLLAAIDRALVPPAGESAVA
ncbi:MAG: sensor histidine kinase [Caulobacter sp.]|nr:sensor histidine kinase [Caulobacter sp.]